VICHFPFIKQFNSPRHVITMASEAPPKRKRSCLSTAIISFVDGGFFGAAIGSIIASVQGLSGLAAGTESIRGVVMHILRSGGRSGASLGFALGSYSGGVCSMEKARGKSDIVNPFMVGGVLGAFGSVQRVDVHDGQSIRRVFAASPRAMLGGSISSGLLCSVFWFIQQPSRKQREQHEQQQQQQQQVPMEQQQALASATLLAQLDHSAPTMLAADALDNELSLDAPSETPLSGFQISSFQLPELPEVPALASPPEVSTPDVEPAFEPQAQPLPEALVDPWAK
jgi:hypothetical protein